MKKNIYTSVRVKVQQAVAAATRELRQLQDAQQQERRQSPVSPPPHSGDARGPATSDSQEGVSDHVIINFQ